MGDLEEEMGEGELDTYRRHHEEQQCGPPCPSVHEGMVAAREASSPAGDTREKGPSTATRARGPSPRRRMGAFSSPAAVVRRATPVAGHEEHREAKP